MRNQHNDSDQEHVDAVPSRREALITGAAIVAAPFLRGVTSSVQAAQAEKVRGTATEWLSYSGDQASSKYSPLDQISEATFNRLRTAWTWRSVEEKVTEANHLKTWAWEATPLMVG